MNINTPDGLNAAKAWTKRMIDSLKDGGFWMIPRSQSTYRFFKDSKEYSVEGPGDSATDCVLYHMGWTRRVDGLDS